MSCLRLLWSWRVRARVAGKVSSKLSELCTRGLLFPFGSRVAKERMYCFSHGRVQHAVYARLTHSLQATDDLSLARQLP